MNRKKLLLAFLRDNSKGKRGTNSHKGKNMKKIPKNILKKTVCGNPPRQFQRQKEKTYPKQKNMKNTRKRVRKKQIWQFSGTNDSRGKRRTNSQNYENMKQLKPMQKKHETNKNNEDKHEKHEE